MAYYTSLRKNVAGLIVAQLDHVDAKIVRCRFYCATAGGCGSCIGWLTGSHYVCPDSTRPIPTVHFSSSNTVSREDIPLQRNRDCSGADWPNCIAEPRPQNLRPAPFFPAQTQHSAIHCGSAFSAPRAVSQVSRRTRRLWRLVPDGESKSATCFLQRWKDAVLCFY